MRYLASLPEKSIASFHKIFGKSEEEWYCTSDPKGEKVGSGGGTSWLLSEAWKSSESDKEFSQWLSEEKKILIHGGGQSRRLPAYASMGKLLLPIPVYRWERGQRLNQTLLDLQLPLLKKLFKAAPSSSHTLLASGDALILSEETFSDLPDTDIISFGLSVDPSLASRHGVFICPRENPETLEYMLQKPKASVLRELAVDHLFYIDLGIWILSDKAVKILMKKCGWDENNSAYQREIPSLYDFYGTFGLALGENPKEIDPEIASLSTAVINLPKGEFYHFGSSKEIISSSLALQNKVSDQRAFLTRNIKPNSAMFVQNAVVDIPLLEEHAKLWIENSYIGEGWKLGGNQIISGIPENKWKINLSDGICLDISPLTGGKVVIRPYSIEDSFRGNLGSSTTKWLNTSFIKWLKDRNLNLEECSLLQELDIQEAALFPVVSLRESIETLIEWMIDGSGEGKDIWLRNKRLSASEITNSVNLESLEKQRVEFRCHNWSQLGINYNRSVFYQVDLNHAAQEFASYNIHLPEPLTESENSLIRAHDHMFRSRLKRYKGESPDKDRNEAFRILQQSILDPIIKKKVFPIKNVYDDQIIWSRSPVRIDLAGGWTDTPPYSVLSGGKVVNISLELNGQPPLQAFIRPLKERVITLRSIDLGEREIITSYADLTGYDKLGSPFVIPKAALCLSGFHPSFSSVNYPDLKTQLEEFGCGIEISFLAAIPKGSGMGTSSNLAATILGGLSDLCNLKWDSFEICNRTLGLEQLLTTGGGWQDQYGGVIPGVKLLETESGWDQSPRIRWLPDKLFTDPEYQSSMLLYYTGITRVARNLLSEIVEGMFLNEHDRLSVLKEMKQHAIDTWEVIQQGNYEAYAQKINKTWDLNKQLDSGTTNPEIDSLISRIEDLSIGHKLPGAGGGGYFYICAKDPEAAQRIKSKLNEDPLNPLARFVDMKISKTGMVVSRS
jgi:fucokinase / fucose-1-phosphate guanylyltransferase